MNAFYKLKEQELVQRGSILDKQICALAGVKKLLEQDRVRQDASPSDRQSELGTCNQYILTCSKCAQDTHLVYDLGLTHF